MAWAHGANSRPSRAAFTVQRKSFCSYRDHNVIHDGHLFLLFFYLVTQNCIDTSHHYGVQVQIYEWNMERSLCLIQ